MKRNIVIAVVTAAALVGGGTATALAVSGDDAPTTRATQTRGTDDDTARDDDRDDDRDDRGREDADDRDGDDDARVAVTSDVTAADAIAAALRHTPGTAVSAELDDEDDDGNGGKAVWEVGVLAGGDTRHSVRVDPATGEVLGAQKDGDDDVAEVRAALKGTSVTAGEAARAAAAKGTVTSVDLDDDGDRGWEAETRATGGDERDWRVGPDDAKVTADRDDDGGDDSDDD
ncbi:PepSY domain-containing protein [Streptomyces sp. Tu 3180]|uniref:PepSY domain-containing protein n=1 Tax=Streptomyces sp. Tu 3180 TaxID=2682611 RepID=UPI00135A141B|nr:PepSY domain-containing protein [Streptomyces sp. Tu 3180]KAF3467550.1 PepSY domain-containing protein [Streptomyces sp. Tu 3180]